MDENPAATILDGSILNVQFGIATPKDIRTSSTNDCPITHASQLMNPFLGLPLETGKCESCGTVEQAQCEGHFGFIELPTAVYHPCHTSQLKNILSLICLKCLRLKKSKVRLSVGVEKLKDAMCPYCRGLPPISVHEVKTLDHATSLELKVSAKLRLREGFWNFLDKYGSHYDDGSCRPLLPCEVLEIFKKIPEDTKRKLSVKGHFPHPGYILQYVPVPPNCLYVPDISDGKSTMSNDTSIPMLKKILAKVDLIKRSRSGPPNFESHEVESNELQAVIAQYMHLRGTKKAPIDNFRKMQPATEASQVSAKQWLEKMKSLFISKGSGFSSRSVLTGDPYRGINEIGIPSEIAKKMTFEERVTSWNLQRLQELVDKGKCLRYKDGTTTYSTEESSRGHTNLRVGQVVSRRIMDGDIVFVNRPPTTHKHALQAFTVYVHDDKTVKINPLICAPFGADFDGDCVHIFYPQCLAAKAEVLELFSVEKQLCSSHSGNLNLQLVNDSILALKRLYNTPFMKKPAAQQLEMFVSPINPFPAIVKAQESGPFWSVPQILQSTLPADLSCSGEKHLISKSEILKLDLNRDSLQHIFSEIGTSILVSKGPKYAMQFVNLLQPLLMETLFLEGFNLSLKDFYIPMAFVTNLRANVQEISTKLRSLRLSYNEAISAEVDSGLSSMKLFVQEFILRYSSLGDVVDSKSDSSILKVVQQLAFLGLQLFVDGKLYSRSLVDDMYTHFVKKYSTGKCDPSSEAFGLIKNSFFHGLNPYEELVHSISSREVIVRSSRGLAEPGTLFKNLMAILRDVAICYDGTVRNVCSNSVIQFEYEADGQKSVSSSPPGEPVGVLAATAISNPAYKAVLDSSQTTNSSWERMKEVLLSRVSFNNDVKSRRVIIYLQEKLIHKEKAAIIVQRCLKKVTLRECASEFCILYENQMTTQDDSEGVSGLVGHIHLNMDRLNEFNQSASVILQKCCDAVSKLKKKSELAKHFKKVAMSSSDLCGCNHPCLMLSYHADSSSSECNLMLTSIHLMAHVLCPFLLDTVVKGNPQIYSANITWIEPNSIAWVNKSGKKSKGELGIEVVVEREVVKRNGDAWRIVIDCCLPVIHLIDTARSIPYGLQQNEHLLGISCAFDLSVQRLSAAIRSVSRGVLKEHLMLVAHSMTCNGNVIGFNTSGYRSLFRSLSVQLPFSEATLVTPMKCFEKAAEKCHTDTLSSTVASSLWGKNVAMGTGTRFQIVWNRQHVEKENFVGKDVYDFLHTVRKPTEELESTCIGVDIDDLVEENGNLSPVHDGLEKPTFDGVDLVAEFDDGSSLHGTATWDDSWQKHKPLPANSDGWEKFSAPVSESNGWAQFANKSSESLGGGKDVSLEPKSNGWEKNASSTGKRDDGWAGVAATEAQTESWDKKTSTPGKRDGWAAQVASKAQSGGWENHMASGSQSDGWEKHAGSGAQSDGWNQVVSSTGKHDGWAATATSEAQPDSWDKNTSLLGKHDGWATKAASNAQPCGWEKNTASGSQSDEREKLAASGPQSDGSENRAATGAQSDAWAANADSKALSEGWEKKASSKAPSSGWEKHTVSGLQSNEQEKHAASGSQSDGWEQIVPLTGKHDGWFANASKAQSDSWENNASSLGRQDDWSGKAASKAQSGGWEKHTASGSQSNNWEKNAASGTHSDGWEKHPASGKKTDTLQSCGDKPLHSGNRGQQNSEGGDNSWGKVQVDEHVNPNKSNSWDSPNDKIEEGNWNKDEMHANAVREPSTTWTKKNVGRNSRSNANQLPQSHGWDSQRDGQQRNQGPGNPKNWNSSGILTATGRRLDTFTSKEAEILSLVESAIQKIRKIMHQSGYTDGGQLSEEDQTFITSEVFKYHPDRLSKVSGDIDYVTIDKHTTYPDTRCFYIVCTDGSRTDFSYIKCMQNFVKESYEDAETFSAKYFKQRRPEAQRNDSISQLPLPPPPPLRPHFPSQEHDSTSQLPLPPPPPLQPHFLSQEHDSTSPLPLPPPPLLLPNFPLQQHNSMLELPLPPPPPLPLQEKDDTTELPLPPPPPMLPSQQNDGPL